MFDQTVADPVRQPIQLFKGQTLIASGKDYSRGIRL
jgi:hypothetical protein